MTLAPPPTDAGYLFGFPLPYFQSTQICRWLLGLARMRLLLSMNLPVRETLESRTAFCGQSIFRELRDPTVPEIQPDRKSKHTRVKDRMVKEAIDHERIRQLDADSLRLLRPMLYKIRPGTSLLADVIQRFYNKTDMDRILLRSYVGFFTAWNRLRTSYEGTPPSKQVLASGEIIDLNEISPNRNRRIVACGLRRSVEARLITEPHRQELLSTLGQRKG